MYDGSVRSASNPLSINYCLLVEPNLIPKLFVILIGFCWNRIAIIADIEKGILEICSDFYGLRTLQGLIAKLVILDLTALSSGYVHLQQS